MFITIEGPDGVGKSTVINGLLKYNPDAIYIREPGTTWAGEKIREILLNTNPYDDLEKSSELLLFVTSFAETSSKLIRPALKERKMVIADRWFYSTIAYQLYAKNDNSWLSENFQSLLKNCNIEIPQLNIILMAPFNDLLDRINKRELKKDKIESRGLNYKKKLYKYYQEICVGERIDSSGTKEETLHAVNELISQKIKEKKSL